MLPGGGPPNQYNVKNADGAIGGNPAGKRFPEYGPKVWTARLRDGLEGHGHRIPGRGDPDRGPVGSPRITPVGVGAPPGNNHYPFDPTELIGGVGYVWHCHILDHEDNEMMRNYMVGWARQPVQAIAVSPDLNGQTTAASTVGILPAYRGHPKQKR